MKVMVIVKASKASEAGEMPSQQLLTEIEWLNAARIRTMTSPRSSFGLFFLPMISAASSPPNCANRKRAYELSRSG